MPDIDAIGSRVRTLRIANDMSQTTLAGILGAEGNSLVSKIENARLLPDPHQIDELAGALGCTPEFLLAPAPDISATRPWLRAYADAPTKTVDSVTADNAIAHEWTERANLRRLPDSIPRFDDDAENPHAIEEFVQEVRAALGLPLDSPVGNAIRAAEKLGCVVLPLSDEVGRHLGISQYINSVPYIRVSRRRPNVPGDRQRFTVAHELGHLALHAQTPPPTSTDDARRLEAQAHRFAGALLTPHQALLDDLDALGGRVTLTTLQSLKANWGVAIKMLVVRLRQLDRITSDQATALYKQISKRGWNSGEPVSVTNERAVWLEEAVVNRWGTTDPLATAAVDTGLGVQYVQRWLDWQHTDSGPTVVRMPHDRVDRARRPSASRDGRPAQDATVISLRPRG